MKLASGHEVEVLEGEELAKQMKDFHGYADGLVRLTPGRWLFPKPYLRFADKYFQFEFRPSDVVVDTYPKCGTTWMQEIIWTMKHNPDLTNPLAGLNVLVRSPFMEMDMLFPGTKPDEEMSENPFLQGFKLMCPGKDPNDGMNLQMAECVPDPRVIKTHLPLSLVTPSLLDTCKVVYVARNPKDMVVSYHHHSKLINMHGFKGTWEDFVEYFVTDDRYGGNIHYAAVVVSNNYPPGAESRERGRSRHHQEHFKRQSQLEKNSERNGGVPAAPTTTTTEAGDATEEKSTRHGGGDTVAPTAAAAEAGRSAGDAVKPRPRTRTATKNSKEYFAEAAAAARNSGPKTKTEVRPQDWETKTSGGQA